MARQFRLINTRPSADGTSYTAEVIDRDWTRFTEPPQDVKVLYTNDQGNPVVRFPAAKLVGGNVLDFDRP